MTKMIFFLVLLSCNLPKGIVADSSISECRDYTLLISCKNNGMAEDGVQCVIRLAQKEFPSFIKVLPHAETDIVTIQINFSQKSEKQIDRLYSEFKKCAIVKNIKILSTNPKS